jgi:hypothetical protein
MSKQDKLNGIRRREAALALAEAVIQWELNVLQPDDDFCYCEVSAIFWRSWVQLARVATGRELPRAK